jgi:hypothetical protein
MLFIAAMGEIEAGDSHAGIYHGLQGLNPV